MRKFIRMLAPGAALLGLLALVTAPASVGDAQDVYGFHTGPLFTAEFSGHAIPVTDDTDIMAIFKYVGVPGTGYTASSTTMEVSAGDFTFLLSGSAVTTFECPISGAYGGIIDTTNAACNTWGEVVDIINLYGYDDGWRVVLIDGKRGDTPVTGLITGAAVCGDWDGCPVLLTTAEETQSGDGTPTEFISTQALLTPRQHDIDYYLGPAPDFDYVPDPFANQRHVILDVDWITTYGSETSGLYITAQDYLMTDVRATPTMSIGTEIDLYYQISGTSTNTADADIGTYGLFTPWGKKIFVRIVNSAALATRTQTTQAFMVSKGMGGGVEYR